MSQSISDIRESQIRVIRTRAQTLRDTIKEDLAREEDGAVRSNRTDLDPSHPDSEDMVKALSLIVTVLDRWKKT